METSFTLGFSYARSVVDGTHHRPTAPRLQVAFEQLPQVTVIDVSPYLPPLVDRIMHQVYRTRVRGETQSVWGRSRLKAYLLERLIHKRSQGVPLDATIQLHGFFQPPQPYFVYTDLSYAMVRHFFRELGDPAIFPGVTDTILAHQIERQQHYFENAQHIFAMSAWLAHHLQSLHGIPARQISVVPPGTNSEHSPRDSGRTPPQSEQTARVPKLLFVGGDFYRKGGDLVIRAFQHCRQELPGVQLTIVGPHAWPLAGAPPRGCHFSRVATYGPGAAVDADA